MKQCKILIADDETDFVQTLQDRLRAEGFETLTAFEGVRAIELAHKDLPDLIILDLKMPAGTGDTVLKALRSKQDTRKIPVLVLTALDKYRLEEEMLRQGAQSFVQKPYEWSHLKSEIHSLLHL